MEREREREWRSTAKKRCPFLTPMRIVVGIAIWNLLWGVFLGAPVSWLLLWVVVAVICLILSALRWLLIGRHLR